MTTLILSGKSGAGKDTFARFLQDEMTAQNKSVIIIHYADILKFFLKEYYNWDGNKDEHGRYLLQHVGTDMMRTLQPNYWTGVVVGFLATMEYYNEFDLAIIADARFQNEIEIAFQHLHKVYCARIERKNADGSEWINPNLTPEQFKHPSETSLDNYVFDYIIHNDEGWKMLKESARTLLMDLGFIKGDSND